MDPISFVTFCVIGGFFVANRIATGFASKKKAAPATGAEKPHGISQERMGSGRAGLVGHDASGEARSVPEQHLRVNDEPEPAPPAVAPPDTTVLQVVRDRATGKFVKKAA